MYTCTCLIASGSSTAHARQQTAILAVTIQISLQKCLTKHVQDFAALYIDLNAFTITPNFRKVIKQKHFLLSVPITSELAIANTTVHVRSCNTHLKQSAVW